MVLIEEDFSMYEWFIICLCSLFEIVAGRSQENAPEVITLLNEYGKNGQDAQECFDKQEKLSPKLDSQQISYKTYERESERCLARGNTL